MNKEDVLYKIKKWLDSDSWNYTYDKTEHYQFRMQVRLDLKKSKEFSAWIHICVKDNLYAVYTTFPLSCEEKQYQPELIKYLMLANENLFNGNFEFKFDDGMIAYKTFTCFEDLDELSDAIIKRSIYTGPKMMNTYGDGIAALVMGFSDAESEIKKAEEE